MLIEIDNTVLDFLNNNQLSCSDKEIIALNSLAMSCYHGHHIIIASADTLDRLSSFDLLNELSRKVFQSLFSKVYYLDNYKKYVNSYIVVYKENCSINQNTKSCFYLPLEQCMIIQKSVLITEDLRDCSFYISLCNEILKEESKDNDIMINLESVSCSGSQAKRAINNELKDNHFILIIMDSDKNYSTGKIGGSAEAAKHTCDEIINQNSHVIEYLELGVRSKENVIPPSLLLLCGNPNNAKELLVILENFEIVDDAAEFLKFINIKEGLKAKDFLINDLSMHNLYKSYVDIIMKSLSKEYPTEEDLMRQPEIKLFSGIGVNYIEMFEKDVLLHGLKNRLIEIEQRPGVPKEVIDGLVEKVHKCDNIITIAPQYIKSEWEAISKSIITYGCCMPETLRTVN